jgi:hypothetical protein
MGQWDVWTGKTVRVVEYTGCELLCTGAQAGVQQTDPLAVQEATGTPLMPIEWTVNLNERLCEPLPLRKTREPNEPCSIIDATL